MAPAVIFEAEWQCLEIERGREHVDQSLRSIEKQREMLAVENTSAELFCPLFSLVVLSWHILTFEVEHAGLHGSCGSVRGNCSFEDYAQGAVRRLAFRHLSRNDVEYLGTCGACKVQRTQK